MKLIYIDQDNFINDFMVHLCEKMNFEPYSNNEMFEKILNQIKSSLSEAELSTSLFNENDHNDSNKYDLPGGYVEILKGFKQSLIDSNIALEKTRFENTIKIELFKLCINRQNKIFDENLCSYRIGLETMKEQGIL